MKENKLMDAMTEIKDDYVIEAIPDGKKKKFGKVYYRPIAAVFAIVLAIGFSFTKPGVSALGRVKGLIESLFPPKDVVVNLEGEREVHTNEAGGQEPSADDSGNVKPGFAIYYDKEIYEMTEKNGITYISFITDDDDDLPVREMTIENIPGKLPEDEAKDLREQMLTEWKSVSEIEKLDELNGLCFSISSGDEWDSVCGEVYILDDENGGSFKIIARYFVEAAEGHGSRFAQMLQTFKVINP